MTLTALSEDSKGANQLITEEGSSGRKQFTYDRQGGILEEKNSTGIRLFSYNSRHQQTTVETESGNVQENRYDVENLRFELLENGRHTSFVYHNGELLREKGGSEKQISYHLGAGIDALQRGRELSYYHRDEQLSTAYITGGHGEIQNGYLYDAFGAEVETNEQLSNRIRYTGQQYDGLAEQYYLKARYYNPILGRFMQEDVYWGSGLNLYAYCKNSPIMYYDPSGYTENNLSPDGNCVGSGKVGTGKGEEQSNNRVLHQGVDDPDGNYLYRTIRSDEVIENGLAAKNPDAEYSLTGHVISNGKEGYASQYISTTKDFDNVAKPYADATGNRVVRIDVDQLPDDIEIYDVSTRENAEKLLNGPRAQNYATASAEVDIQGYIPADAIELYYSPKDKE